MLSCLASSETIPKIPALPTTKGAPLRLSSVKLLFYSVKIIAFLQTCVIQRDFIVFFHDGHHRYIRT